MKARSIILAAAAAFAMLAIAPAAEAGDWRRDSHRWNGHRGHAPHWRPYQHNYRPHWRPPVHYYAPPPVYYAPRPYAYAPPSIYFGFTVP